ncbi:putative Lactose permease [Glarea lozoyensis 74030]|uniref:Putative Lactose permease n=1 Tax=Glarea lozoyensis (strain ATCC 74030 / MF5533) TaxID=1104152 RepID=H0EW66_GLAL7|nr:putative Lactose permease [Glarea lozoyensis 74030]
MLRPMYVVEVSHPAYRGVVTAVFNCFWFTGSIIASGVARGGLNIGGNTSWRLIIWIQLMFSSIIFLAAYFLPESPRWLHVNGKQEAAKKMLTKYHGNGNSESDAFAQANVTLINNCQQFCFALLGAALVDRLYGTNKAAGTASLAFIFIFGAVFSVGFTPLQALYPVEVLSFEMRAKGMGFSGFAVAASGMLNQFAWPVSLQKIGWHTYIIFTIWCGIQAVVVFFFIPETKNRTLEELDEIFEAKNPVKASIAKKRLGFDAYGEVVNIRPIEI